MPSPLSRALRRPASDLSFSVFLVTVLLCLLRSGDLPSIDLRTARTTVSVGPADVALLATAVLAALRLRARRTLPSPWLLAAAAVLALLIVASAIPNGAVALTSAGKLTELAALTLGAAAFLDTRERFGALAKLIVAYTIAAVLWGAVGFVGGGAGRQGSFLGEHDLAAVGTMALAVGLARIHSRTGRPGLFAIVAIAAGGLGITLGASLASLLGLYLTVAAVLALALARHRLRLGAVLATLGVAVAVTAGTLSLRSGDLGFIQEWFGPEPERPGQYAASWSQRLIYAYVGGRVFLDQPLLGTGWHGELPPEEYARYLPDARERFSDQPAPYFPSRHGTFIPQQTYDQVLFELGLVGGVAFLTAALLAMRQAVWAGIRWAGEGAPAELGYVPVVWLAGLGGTLAGAALFGGAPITAMFWLILGVAAAAPVLVPASNA
jgi:O-antigen ligase/polysaccharide polymerase Wzy-like membrane protein